MGSTKRIQEMVSGYISEKKQFPDGDSVALLTVAGVGTFSYRGSLDFGGSEYKQAKIKWLQPQKKADDEKYGWWHLSEGMYIIELNERVRPAEGSSLYLQVWESAETAGIVHPSGIIHPQENVEETTPLRITVSVGSTGVDIKENARISRLVLL